MELNAKLLEIARAGRHPPEPDMLGRAVALGEGEKAPPHWVPDELQQDEQIAWAVGERRAGERVQHSVRRGGDELARELGARARVVLEVVRLVEDHARPWEGLQVVLGQYVVVDDDPRVIRRIG